jgi:hypothetical protein
LCVCLLVHPLGFLPKFLNHKLQTPSDAIGRRTSVGVHIPALLENAPYLVAKGASLDFWMIGPNGFFAHRYSLNNHWPFGFLAKWRNVGQDLSKRWIRKKLWGNEKGHTSKEVIAL